jgi:glycosyltransferase involved in cell wall biosynthesis
VARKENKQPTPGRSSGQQDRQPVLLFIDYSVPQYDLFAGSRTNFMYLEMLIEMGLEVKFLPEDFHRIEPYSTELNELGIETLDGEWYRQNWENWLRENGQGIDYVFIHKPDPASTFLPAVLRYTNAAVIYQCHDLHHLRLRRRAELENDPAIREEADIYEKKEDFIFSNSDVLLTFSEVEETFIKARFPDKKVFTVPLFFYKDLPEPVRDFHKRHDLIYVGACAHSPNRDALAWFCGEIFPLIQKQVPDIALNVVGADPPAEIASLNSESIRILGRVSEQQLKDLYENVRMMVVPLRFGAGVKGKVIEALANGLPIVSTSIGLEGIKGIDCVASPRDNPADFAAAVVGLYTDTGKLAELSRSGSNFIAEHFTVEKTAALMNRILSVSTQEAAPRIREKAAAGDRQAAPRLIAFYLPQYHTIPENDEWWGKGFTEWQNVSRAQPLFSGHYQPHVPADLGYYDLRRQETQIAQAELARKYAIEGFCYYHYWFNGKRLLDHPLQQMITSGKPDFPFCMCWANENWTRRWDGEDKSILMKQVYSEEDDRKHIRALLPVFEDKRYIRVNGKPLFLVYRTENLPDPARTAEIWREEARKAGIGELFLCRVESIGQCDPRAINFDAAVEFAPDWSNCGPVLKVDAELPGDAGTSLKEVRKHHYLHSYQTLADSMMAKEIPGYKWFRCVTPSWDNSARRDKGANIFLGSTPRIYQDWLSQTIAGTNNRLYGQERIVFVNAWNEWAEGCHLEPDQKFGHGYLAATRHALEDYLPDAAPPIPGSSNDGQVNRLTKELADSNYQLKVLESRVAQREQQIEDILASTSWKVSLPIRWLKQRLLDLKKIF